MIIEIQYKGGENMTLTREDLNAIAVIVKTEIEPIKVEIADMKSDISELQSDMREVKEDIATMKVEIADMKSDISELQSDVTELKTNVSELQSDVAELKTNVSELQSDVSKLQFDVTDIKVTKLENGALKTLDDLHSCYVDTFDRYKNGADRFDGAFSDIDNLKVTVTDHSVRIHKLELKKA